MMPDEHNAENAKSKLELDLLVARSLSIGSTALRLMILSI
jgi:hypothetical protein